MKPLAHLERSFPPTNPQILRLLRAVYPSVPQLVAAPQRRIAAAKGPGLGQRLAYRVATGGMPGRRVARIAFWL